MHESGNQVYPTHGFPSPDPVQQSEGGIGMEGPAETFLDEINSVDSIPPLIVEIPCVHRLNIFHQKYCRIWTQRYNSLGQARTRPPLPRPTSLPQNGQLLYLTI